MSNLDSIFHEARKLSGEARTAYLQNACAGNESLRREVEALLKADDAAGSFLRTARGSDDPDATTDGTEALLSTSAHIETAGQLIGRFKLLQRIGQGGFGTVWMAEQKEPVKRRVALKVIKLGMDTKQVIARFEAERQALAMMDHPNIARVLDAGATETGRPYFVMELVRGVPVLDFCDSEKLDMRQRLELFIQICNAIQHAHQKGIIHRDIKPSNVLVTLHDGVPVVKVIDFGIAKATNTELTQKTLFTEHRQLIGTPAYMSPEQAEMSGLDIDTRSDVYSLGVLLYELLTGTKPFDEQDLMSKGFAEMMRMIREVEPQRPSTRLFSLGDTASKSAEVRRVDPKRLYSMLRGELDWIVMKCLEKDRARRYETANGLADDIRRYLAGDAILAMPPSAVYRARKFVQRNRAAVCTAAAMVALLLIGVVGTSLGTYQSHLAKEAEIEQRLLAETNAVRALAEAERAEAEAERAESEAVRARIAEAHAAQRADELELVVAFQATQLQDIETQKMGVDIRQNIIQRRREILEAIGEDDEVIEAALKDVELALAGVNFTNIALDTLDQHIFERALLAIDEQFNDQPLVKARLLQTLARTMRSIGLLNRAEAPQARSLEIRQQLLGNDDPDTLQSIMSKGLLMKAIGRLDEAEAYHRTSLEAHRRVLGNDHADTIQALSNMGTLLWRRGDTSEAEVYMRQSLEAHRLAMGDEDSSTLTMMSNLGLLLREQGRLDEAEQLLREALEGRRRVLGDEHASVVTSLNSIGFVHHSRGEFAEAEEHFRQAVEISQRVLGQDHRDTLASINNLAFVLHPRGKLAESASFLRQAVEGYRRTVGPDHPDTLTALMNVGAVHYAQNNNAEAEAYWRAAMDGYRRVLGSDHPSTLRVLNNLSLLLERQSRFDEAEQHAREALRIRRHLFGADHPETLDSYNAIGVMMVRQRKPEQAMPYLQHALDGRKRVFGEEHHLTIEVMSFIASAHQHLEDFGAAAALYRTILEARHRTRGTNHVDLLLTKSNLGACLRELGQLDEAAQLGKDATRGLRSAVPGNDWRLAGVQSQHARTLAAKGRFHEAVRKMIEAHNIFESVLGRTHIHTVDTARNLAGIYETWHEHDPNGGYDAVAETWREKSRKESR